MGVAERPSGVSSGSAGVGRPQSGPAARRQAVDVAKALRKHADNVARAYMRLFVEAVWKPFEAEGRPEERWLEVSEALERLRPLAAESLVAMFALAMDEATERTFGRQLERLPDPPGP